MNYRYKIDTLKRITTSIISEAQIYKEKLAKYQVKSNKWTSRRSIKLHFPCIIDIKGAIDLIYLSLIRIFHKLNQESILRSSFENHIAHVKMNLIVLPKDRRTEIYEVDVHKS